MSREELNEPNERDLRAQALLDIAYSDMPADEYYQEVISKWVSTPPDERRPIWMRSVDSSPPFTAVVDFVEIMQTNSGHKILAHGSIGIESDRFDAWLSGRHERYREPMSLGVLAAAMERIERFGFQRYN